MKISTDASIFEIEPIDVIYPNNRKDLINHVNKLTQSKQQFTLRAGGTSIGGQAIGDGVLIDVSKHLTRIIDFSEKTRRVKVEPGVIQEDLNDFLKPYNLKFAPDTSTSNRAMIGGMIGNNSCGAYSVYYGTTRDHVESIEVALSDGSVVNFRELSEAELLEKLQLDTLEGDIYRYVINTLEHNKHLILESFPDPVLIRRNTGYAIDELIRKHQPFNQSGDRFSLVPLICGSEGTLATIVSATLKVVDLPRQKSLMVAQFELEEQALKLVEALMQFKPAAVEFIDKPTLDASRKNIAQNANRSWIKGDPEAVLVIEFFANSKKSLQSKISNCQKFLSENNSYDASIIPSLERHKVWDIRKAGLGLLMGKSGPRKALAVIEDAAIPLKHLYSYYIKVKEIMSLYGVNAVYYGHASVGLIHIRPELDLSLARDRQTMKLIAEDVSQLVKQYRGSLSGEHGDGRIRAPYLKQQVGDEVYQILLDLKQVFDPNRLLNPGVIIGQQPIDRNLRTVAPLQVDFQTGFDWQEDLSFFSAAEKCNGAGACRKSVGKGVMCPSYKATRDERLSTRGRANLLRWALSTSDPIEALNNTELKEALALCLSCKSCKSECPSSVDMSRLKSEYLYQTQREQDQIELWRTRNLGTILRLGSKVPSLFNKIQNSSLIKNLNKLKGNLPSVQRETLSTWWTKQNFRSDCKAETTVWVFCDIFTEYYDVKTGIEALKFLRLCQVNVELITLDVSIVAMISKGLLDEAKQALNKYYQKFSSIAKQDLIVGIDPSEVLVWRDDAKYLVEQTLIVNLFEELVLDLHKRDLLPKLSTINKEIYIHLHCHQKALIDKKVVTNALSLIPRLKVKILNTGCCGAAGDFRYTHPKLSNSVYRQSFKAKDFAQCHKHIFVNSFHCRNLISKQYETSSVISLFFQSSNT